jgi:DNA-binding CsgD family transcriptional regulator
MPADFKTLFETAAALVKMPEGDDLTIGQGLVELLKSLAAFSYCVVFAYRGEARPLDLFSTFTPEQYHIYVRLYQEGPYLLDPFYRAATLPRPGIWRMRELAPDRFFASEYYRNYYVETRLAEEVGYFVPVGQDVTVVLSLMRAQDAGSFRPAEYELLRKAEPLVSALVQKLWLGVGGRFDIVHVDDAEAQTLRPWSNRNLTTREKAIIELVLQGHSSESIGLSLGIATGTVKVHRRNIYRKLGIASQTQLMSLYLDSLKA